MQAPKDGDSIVWDPKPRDVYERVLQNMQDAHKRSEDPRTSQDRGEPSCSFVTRNCETQPGNAAGLSDAFMRGFAKGMHPLRPSDVLASSAANADATTYTHGMGVVHVSGLELMQATDLEALGVAKGEALRQQSIGQGVGLGALGGALGGVPIPGTEGMGADATLQGGVFTAGADGLEVLALKKQVEAAIFGAVAGVPVPQVLGWSGGGSPEGSYGVVTLDIEGAAVRYVPERTRRASGVVDFDHWYASPYTRVYEKHIQELQQRRDAVDGMLSLVLHELAGEASLCWEPKPEGVFDSSAGIAAVERAIGVLRPLLRGVE